MKLVLFRHATRPSISRLADSEETPLSEQGREQALNLCQIVSLGKLPTPQLLITSPKARAEATLSPLASALGLKLRLDPRLDERHLGESTTEFLDRVSLWLSDIELQTARTLQTREAGETSWTFICSHQDWLEEVTNQIRQMSQLKHEPKNKSSAVNTPDCSWRNGEFRAYHVESGIWSELDHGIL